MTTVNLKRLGWALCFLLVPLFVGCSEDEDPFYVVKDEVRTPILQILQKNPGTDPGRVGCFDLATGASGASESWCQQFPVRPDAPVLLRFVLLSPAGGSNQAEIVSISQLTGFVQGALSARVSPATGLASRDIPLEDFAVLERPDLAKVLAESPLRIEERYISLTLPSTDALFAEFRNSGALPGYTFTYTAANAPFRSDRGFVTFYVLPEPTSTIFQGLERGQFSDGEPPSEELLANLRQAATSNTPPVLTGLTPDGGTLASGEENRLELSLGDDPDEGAKSRIQWFVSAGELSNMVSRRPKWKPESTGPVAAFAMIRDLQGGSDFIFRVFESQ